MFIIPSIDLSMKLSLSEVFVSNIIVTMVISNKSCCKHVLFTNLSDFISTTTRVTSVKSKKFLFCSFSVAKFGIAPFFTSLYPSSEGSMRSTLLHPPIIPHYDHITSVIHTVTHLLDPLLQPSTMGENRDFWLLWTSLIFQVISWELDVNLLKHISMRFLAQIKRYFKFVLSVI